MKFVYMCSADLVVGNKFTNTQGSYYIFRSATGELVSIQKNPAINNSDISKVKNYYKAAHKALVQDESGFFVPTDVPEFSKVSVSEDGTEVKVEWKNMVENFIKNIISRYKSMKLTTSDNYSIYLNKEDWKKFKAKNYAQIMLKEIVSSKPDATVAAANEIMATRNRILNKAPMPIIKGNKLSDNKIPMPGYSKTMQTLIKKMGTEESTGKEK